MWDIRVGMKVICVNDDIGTYSIPGISYGKDLDGLKRGEIYTVREFGKQSPLYPSGDESCIRLKEILRPKYHGTEVGYHPDRFRPLNKNFSVFEEILKQPLKIKEKV